MCKVDYRKGNRTHSLDGEELRHCPQCGRRGVLTIWGWSPDPALCRYMCVHEVFVLASRDPSRPAGWTVEGACDGLLPLFPDPVGREEVGRE